MLRRSSTVSALIGSVLLVGACAGSSAPPEPSTAVGPAPSAVSVTDASPATAVGQSAAPSSGPGADASSEPSAATSSAGPSPTPAPWATYASTRYKYAVKHPPDWVVTAGTADLADQIDDNSSHFVFLSRDVVSGVASISLTATHDRAYLKDKYKATLLSDKKVKVGGWSGRLLTFDGIDNGRELFIQHLILAKGKVGYIIDMYSDRGSAKADAALFKRIYATWRSTS